MEKETLYVPQGLRLRNEIITGFGKEEMIRAVIVNLIVGAIVLAAYLLTGRSITCIVIMMGCVFASVIFQVKDPNLNLSFVDLFKNTIRFGQVQKKYLYKYIRERGQW
jgi:hypothetical protein